MNLTLAVGDSMLPTMSKVGLIVSKKVSKYEVGDIIELETYDLKIHCHRIVKIDDKLVTTKGDNYPRSIDYEIDVPVSKIRGKIIWWWPRERPSRHSA